MGAFRIFSRFAELLDIKVTRAAAAWLRLNTDGTVSERTASQTVADLGVKGMRVFAIDADLLAGTPDYIGQLAYSIDTDSLWIGDVLTAGGWSGGLRATSFIGSGAFLTDLPAANLTGNIARARIDNALSANAAPIVATTVTASGAVTAKTATITNNSGYGQDAEFIIAGNGGNSFRFVMADPLGGSATGWPTGSVNLRLDNNGDFFIRHGSTQRFQFGRTTGNLTASGTVTEGVYTVATTPTHSLGASIRINNATGATIGGVVAGTGSQHVVARSNGTQWICTAIIIP